ncbi:hypothetical protein Taro_030046 [Colocasia esculenta]|uniref:Receptor kinase-like protein Xa21 n=1 Tax=Colocasia esculenta TaxID=4460 RepID=A0A843VZ08_COLES|nr:hypothetical protein [Colocasia esculenta]
MACLIVISAYVLLISCLACYPATCSSESAVRVASPTGNSGDRMALLTFKTSLTRDPSRALASWNDTLPLCRWRGVRCGRGHRDRVTELQLPSLGLSGPISTSLANLTFLRRLDLSNNSFRRHIPAELGRLSRLRDLNLSFNSLAGEIPTTLANCSHLEQIDLVDNVLVGVVPPSFSSLSSLQVLSLARNRLGGYLSPWLAGNLTSLTVLELSTNFLIGAIPSTVGALISLYWFNVADNNLKGTIPSSLYNLSSLVFLDLGSNQRLSGTLPSDMGVSLPNLQFLSLSRNQFHGSIPSSLPNASALSVIQLSGNNFSGVIPSRLGTLDGLIHLRLSSNQLETKDDVHDLSFLITSLTNCTRLETLLLLDNNLEGVLPSTISNLSKSILTFGVGDNRISGSIPEGIGDLTGLTRLHLGDSLLEGTIPPAIGKLHNLVLLYLPGNQLSGQIPSSMSNLTQLNQCIIDSNTLQGGIPPSLVNLQKLQFLSLSNNKLSGSIPKELFSISSLSIGLDLSKNSLSGVLPTEVGKMTDLNMMDISDNNLSGEIPATLGDCEHLVYLGMRGNTFNGIIPQSFSKLRGLEELDLSRNNLTGGIPDFLQNFLALRYLNLSFNDFDGEVPKGGIFQNASATSVMGNHKLCGGILEFRLNACSPGARNVGRHGHIPWKTVIIVLSTVGFCLVALFLYLIFSHCLRGKVLHPKAPAREMLPRVSYSELFKATEGFSSNNLIGVGSFGCVYRANINLTEPNGGQLVAVKVINLQRRGALKSFMAECEALRNIRHRNLLKILTSCSSTDFSGNDFKALVFEFMPRGSLEQWLHPSESENGRNQYYLNLAQRLSIAVDVASALTYLHQYNYEPIIHCDLKPSNILLDNDMIAHVSDFGIARFLTNDDNRNPSSSLVLRGSIGYIAPEYGMRCKASTKGDVFSYGVLLLEMVTGRKPTDACFGNDLTIHKFVDMAFPEHVLGIVDPDLLREEDGTTADDTMPSLNDVKQERKICLVSMARLGLMCSKESPKQRMQMEAVTREIIAIRDAFLDN